MTTTSEDSFHLHRDWGIMISQAAYDPENDQLPTWLLETFHATCQAVEKLPAEHRDPVIAAALQKWYAGEA